MTTINYRNNSDFRMFSGIFDIDTMATAALDNLLHAVTVLSAARGRPIECHYEPAALRDYYGSMANMLVQGEPISVWDNFSAFYHCKDGYIRTHTNYAHHKARFLAALDVQDNLAAVKQAIAENSATELEERIISYSGVAAAVRSREEYKNFIAVHPIALTIKHPTRNYGELVSAPWKLQSADKPLAGVRIISISRVLAGPTAARILAALGADVLRIDPPDNPEITVQHIDTDNGVRSAIVDLHDRESRARVDMLLASADGIISAYRPGALAKFGYDSHSLTQRFPQLSIATFSAWQDRENSIFYRGFDSIVQAVSGISLALANSDGKPGTQLPCKP